MAGRRIAAARFSAIYADPGYLLYIDDSSKLVARAFDPGSMKISGEPRILAHEVRGSSNTHSAISASVNGVLAYSGALTNVGHLAWFDRSGNSTEFSNTVADYLDIRISPDGSQAAFTGQLAGTDSPDVWVMDLSRGTASKFTIEAGLDGSPVWAPDGKRLYFRSTRDGLVQVYSAILDNPRDVSTIVSYSDLLGLMKSATAGLLLASTRDISPDGTFLICSGIGTASLDIWVFPLNDTKKGSVFQALPSNEIHPSLSPDGRWLAYASDETGRYEIYAQSFPVPGRRVKISSAGGTEPRWRGDGQELYFISADSKMMAVPLRADSDLHPGKPSLLFSVRTLAPSVYRANYDVTKDGQRFLVNTIAGDAPPHSITVLVNWPAVLK